MPAVQRTGVVLFLILLGLGLGVGLGLAVGWFLWPVEYTDTEIADLRVGYQEDYVLMVSDAYALTGDLDAARQRLLRLGVPDLASLVHARVEGALVSGAPTSEVSSLARLAVALGAPEPALAPYLTPVPQAP
jgi:hypothetical protein